jgi:endoglucanase
MHHLANQRALGKFAVAATLLLSAFLGTQARAASTKDGKTLPSQTRFFVPKPADGSIQQAISLFEKGQLENALLITAMEATPQAVWLPSGTPSEVSATVTKTLREAALERAVPTFVLYNIPGRDCGSYSAGGAQNTADYEAWIDAIAAAIGTQKVVIVLEPDALANLPSDCGYNPAVVNIPQATADRYTQINYAVTRLEAGSQTLVYLDAGNSNWHSVGDMATRLVNAGLQQAQGFFSNVSNYRLSNYEVKFDTWISECIAFATNASDGGWRLGHYGYCASQYYSPLGKVDPSNIATWIYSDQWYQQNLGSAAPTTHFIVDTSRNGQGPLNTSVYASAPFNQPAAVVQTLNAGSWCNPPARGLGAHPSANTGVSLLDAYLWVKTPGQSDGSCDAQGGARAWDYTVYTHPGWPTDAAGQATFDPLWGLSDPAAGAWFPQQALDLAQRANPGLLRW